MMNRASDHRTRSAGGAGGQLLVRLMIIGGAGLAESLTMKRQACWRA